jgi:hypothetical protein
MSLSFLNIKSIKRESIPNFNLERTELLIEVCCLLMSLAQTRNAQTDALTLDHYVANVSKAPAMQAEMALSYGQDW